MIFSEVLPEPVIANKLKDSNSRLEIKNHLIDYSLLLELNSDELSVEENYEIKKFARDSIMNCYINLEQIMRKYFTKPRYNVKFCLTDNILIKNNICEKDANEIINDVFTIQHFIINKLIELYKNKINQLEYQIEYIKHNDNQNLPQIFVQIIINSIKKDIEKYKIEYKNILNIFSNLIQFDIDYCLHNIESKNNFHIDEIIYYIILSSFNNKYLSFECSTSDKLLKLFIEIFIQNTDINIRFDAFRTIFQNGDRMNYLKLNSEIIIHNRLSINDVILLSIDEYKKFIKNQHVSDFFQNLIGLLILIEDYVMYINLSEHKLIFDENINNFIYALLDIYNELNNDKSIVFEKIQKSCISIISNLIKIYPDIIYSDIVKHLPYIIVNTVKSNKINKDHLTYFIDVCLLLCRNNEYYLYLANYGFTYEEIDYLIFDKALYDKYSKILSIIDKKINDVSLNFNEDSIENKIIDSITSQYIINLSVLPMDNGQLQFFDKFSMLSIIRNKEIHPLTREKITVQQFLQIQDNFKDHISEINKKRIEFVKEIKTNL
jgi:hypothetical protein